MRSIVAVVVAAVVVAVVQTIAIAQTLTTWKPDKPYS